MKSDAEGSLTRLSWPHILSVLSMITVAVIVGGCGGSNPNVEPSEVTFKGNETQQVSFNGEGPTEYEIIGQSIFEPEEGENFNLESECEGQVLKPKEHEIKSCIFKIKSESFTVGRKGELITFYEPITSGTRGEPTALCTALKMT
jgi:hypothetical protein